MSAEQRGTEFQLRVRAVLEALDDARRTLGAREWAALLDVVTVRVASEQARRINVEERPG